MWPISDFGVYTHTKGAEMDQSNKRKIYIKYQLIQYKGGKCQKCGYDKTYFTRAFTFHHRDPTLKEFDIARGYSDFNLLKKEVDKCDLLCMRCHMEVHDEQYIEKRKQAIEELSLKELNIKSQKSVCQECKQLYRKTNRKQMFCTPDCSSLYKSRSKFSKEQWDHWKQQNKSIDSIAKELRSSSHTIRKYAKQNGWYLNQSRATSVYEYDMQGKFIKEWPSVIEASKHHNMRDCTPISECVSGKRKSIAQRLWKINDGKPHIPPSYNKNYRYTHSDELIYYIKYVPDYTKRLTVAKLARIFDIRYQHVHRIRKNTYRPSILINTFDKQEIKNKIENMWKISFLKEFNDTKTN